MNNFFEPRTFCQWAFRIEFYFSSIPRERATELSPYLFEVIIDNGMAMDSGRFALYYASEREVGGEK